MEYISIKELVLKTQIAKMTFCRWCKSGRVQYHTVTGAGGNGGTHYEILVSSLPDEIQKKIYENIQPAKTQKTLEPPTAAQVSAQRLSSLQTDGIYPDIIPDNIPNINDCMKQCDNSIGVSLENNTDFSYYNITSESCAKALVPFKKEEVSKECETLTEE